MIEWYILLVFSCIWAVVLPIHIFIAKTSHKKIEWSRIGTQFILQSILILSFLYPTLLLPVALSITIYFIAWELIQLNKTEYHFSDKLLVLSIAALPIFYSYLSAYVSSYLILVAVLFLTTQIFIKTIKPSSSSIYTFLLLIILGNAFCFYIPLRHLPNGFEWCFFAISIAKLTDISAYIIGGFYKGYYFINKKVSKSKSIEVMVICYGINALYAWLLSYVFFPSYNLFVVLGLSAIITFLAQLGDLTFSLLKRNSQVKDFSNTFPGIGGVTDWLDSLAFIAVPLYLLFTAL